LLGYLAYKIHFISRWLFSIGAAVCISLIITDTILVLWQWEGYWFLASMSICLTGWLWCKSVWGGGKTWVKPFSLSVVSAYCMMRGVAYFFPQVPSDLRVILQVKNEEDASEAYGKDEFFICLGAFGFWFLNSCCCFHKKVFPPKDDDFKRNA
jgi:hypothetical protein